MKPGSKPLRLEPASSGPRSRVHAFCRLRFRQRIDGSRSPLTIKRYHLSFVLQSLEFLQRRKRHLRLFRIRPVNGLAVVPKGQLRESFGIPALFGPLRPSIAVGVERDFWNAQAPATLLELCRPVAGPHGFEIREKRPCLWKGRKNFLHLFPEAYLRRLLAPPARFHPKEAYDVSVPVHVLSVEIGKVRLRYPKVPGQLIKCLPLRVFLPLDDPAMLLPGDGPLFPVSHGRPLAF